MHADATPRKLALVFALIALVAVPSAWLATHARADDPDSPAPTTHATDKVTGVHAHMTVETPLTEVPGKKLSMVHVDFDPGGAMAPHEHPGTVIVYVIAGTIRSQIGDGSPRIYRAGESWVELPGVRHALCENASTTEPAELVASLVNDLAPAKARAGGADADTLQPTGRHH